MAKSFFVRVLKIFLWFIAIVFILCCLLLFFYPTPDTRFEKFEKAFDDSIAFSKLLANTKDLNEKDDIGYTILFNAVRENKPAIVKLLLKKGADPTIATTYEGNSIERAFYDDLPEIIEIFYQHDSTQVINIVNTDFVLDKIIIRNCSKAMGFMLSHFLSVNQITFNKPLLTHALTQDHTSLELIDTILYYNPNVNRIDMYGRSPIYYADEKTISKLLKKGAVVNIKDKEETSPLFYKVKNGCLSCAKLLIENGAQLENDLFVTYTKNETIEREEEKRTYYHTKNPLPSVTKQIVSKHRLVAYKVPLLTYAQVNDTTFYQFLLERGYKQTHVDTISSYID